MDYQGGIKLIRKSVQDGDQNLIQRMTTQKFQHHDTVS